MCRGFWVRDSTTIRFTSAGPRYLQMKDALSRAVSWSIFHGLAAKNRATIRYNPGKRVFLPCGGLHIREKLCIFYNVETIQTLADLDEQALSQCLPQMDSQDLTLAIRQMEPGDQGKILAKIDHILGADYAEILRMAVQG